MEKYSAFSVIKNENEVAGCYEKSVPLQQSVVLYIKLNVCLRVCTVYKFTFLNQSEPNFAHTSPLVWKIPQGMYGPKTFDLFYLSDLFRRERVPIPRHERVAGASHPRRYIRDSCRCQCNVTEMTLQQTTVLRSYWKCRALWVMHKKHGEMNGMHVCKNGNLMRQEASD